MEELIIYTDGGARGNPGPAGFGIVFYNNKKEKLKEITDFIGKATNNQAEYQALIMGLKNALKLKPKNLKVFLDSELIVNQLNGTYRVKNTELKPLYQRVLKLKDKFNSVSFKHIPREKNKLADRLVNQVLDKNIG